MSDKRRTQWFILEILKKHTDEQKGISVSDVMRLLKSEYNWEVDRKTVKRNLMLLMSYGLDESYANAMAPAIGVMFDRLSKEVTSQDRNAVSSLFSLVFINHAEKNLFSGDGPSTLGMSAYGFVYTIIQSEAVSAAVQRINLNFSSRISAYADSRSDRFIETKKS
jgi:hypothetical protein